MNTTKEEKEWLRRISGCNHITQEDQPKQATNSGMAKVGIKSTVENKSIKGNGFKDIAGMDELKDFVTKGFINVLLYSEHAALYGIKPPAMLFYGPSGCGKTYFAEKMAEEVGINFMKIVPDDLACTWIHGTSRKSAKYSARQRRMHLQFYSLMSLTPWFRKDRETKRTSTMTTK